MPSARACAESRLRARTQRSSGPESGISASSSSPAARTEAMVARGGTVPPSANDTWIPCAASVEATAETSFAGARTIMPTSRWLVFTRESGCTCRITPAIAVTSSVDITHVPTVSSSTALIARATVRSRQRGIWRTCR
jgi:hypothetical protein